MDCSIEGITVANMPMKAGGWRLSNTSTAVYECFNKAACVGADGPLKNASTTSRRRLNTGMDISTAGDALCARGHTGFLCGTCLDKWYGYKDDALCTACEGNMASGFVPLIIILVLLFLAMLVFCCCFKKGGCEMCIETAGHGSSDVSLTHLQQVTMSKGNALLERSASLKKMRSQTKRASVVVERARPKFKILISLYQIIGGIGATFSIPFPSFYEQIVSAVSGVLSINVPTLMPFECFASTNFFQLLAFKTLWPLVAYAILFLLSKGLLRLAGKKRLANSCIDFLFLIMFLMFPTISNGLLSMFYCVQLEDQTSWLRVDLSIQCTDTSGATTASFAAMQAFAVAMIAVHIVGTPATYAYLLFWKHKGAFKALQEQELDDECKAGLEKPKQYTTQYEALAKQDKPIKPRLVGSDVLPGYMQKLSGSYRFDAYWYELFETLRKVLIIGVPATFPERGGTAQLFWGLLVASLTGTILALRSPYKNPRDNMLAQLCQLQIFLTLLSSLALRAIPPSKVVGDLVSIILIAVPLAAVYLETPLFDWTLDLYAGLHSCAFKVFTACHPPAFRNEPSTTSKSSASNVEGPASLQGVHGMPSAAVPVPQKV